MGFWDTASKLAGGGSSTPWYESSDFIVPAFQTAASLIGGLSKPSSIPYSQSEDYLNAQLALEQQKFEADKAYKEQALAIEAAKGGASGAGAAAARYAAALSAKVNLEALRNQNLADQIKMRIENRWGKPEIQEAYNAQHVAAIQNKAAAAQTGFNSAANFLAGARR